MTGRPLSGRAGGLRPEPVAQSQPEALIPDALLTVRKLIEQCEAPGASIWSTIDDVARYIGGDRGKIACKFNNVHAYLDAAVALLPSGAVWRAYTDRCATTYGASPYNAAAQERFDGFADARPLAICAALLRMIEAPLAKAQAIEARRAATTGAVHESAVPEGDAP